jgi:DNA-binding beta-propeller fold protein YncE
MNWGGTGSGYGLFNQPEGVAVDSNGWVYVADSGNSIVEAFSPY